MDRRTALKLIGMSATLPTIGTVSVRAASEPLRVLTWEGYADEQWVDAFKAKTGAEVQVTFVGSVDEIFAKLSASKGADYDTVAIETSSYKKLTDEKLIQPLDLSRIPNTKFLTPAFQKVDAVIFDGKTYAIPYAWGSIPLIYDKAAYPSPPDTWAELWNPANKGKVMVMDEANNNVVTAALKLGIKTPFNLSDAELDQIKAALIEQKKLVSTYYAGFEDGVSIFAQGGITLMMSMGEPQLGMLQKRGVDAALTIPKEGAIGWIDCWAISSGARNLDLVYAWIDFMTQREVGTYISQKTGYGNCTDEAANAEIGMTYADKLVFLQAPENYARRQDIWNDVKAASVE